MTENQRDAKPQGRGVRSFVRRQGRLTPAQQRALEALWPVYGLDCTSTLDFEVVFGRRAPVTLEIGFGSGTSLVEMATREPDHDFVGVDVHRPGVGRLLLALEERGLDNVRVCCHDAEQLLESTIADVSLDRLLLFFPDPWPKTKHHKRRLVKPAFVALVARKLKPGGLFHMATDWEPYASQALDMLQASDTFFNCRQVGGYSRRPEYRPITRFEQRGRRLGHPVRDLIFRRA